MFHCGGHVGRHIGILVSPSFMPIHAGSVTYYRLCGTFWYIISFVIPGVRDPIFFGLDCHPTITDKEKDKEALFIVAYFKQTTLALVS